jgi:hypothetical protein
MHLKGKDKAGKAARFLTTKMRLCQVIYYLLSHPFLTNFYLTFFLSFIAFPLLLPQLFSRLLLLSIVLDYSIALHLIILSFNKTCSVLPRFFSLSV